MKQIRLKGGSPLSAAQRKRRKEIRELIREARIIAEKRRSYNYCEIARVLDDLADIAEKYLKGLK